MNNDTLEQNKPKYDLSFIKNFIDANPHALKELGISQAGRKRGGKNNTSVEAGKLIEIPKELMPIPEDVIEVSRKVAKQLVEKMKKERKPRQYKDEETKTRMLNVLAQGREKSKLNREQKKIENEKQAIERHKASVQIIRVREPKKVVRKEKPEEPESEEDDVEIIRAKKKVEKKKEILKEIEEELNRLPAQGKRDSLYGGQLKGW